MSQSSLDDDELFGEAATEIRTDVEDHLAAARAELPAPEAVWEVESDNTLGVLNALRSALDVGEAEQHLRDARKWYTMGVRADAFEDADDLQEELEALTEVMEDVVAAREQVGELASTIPGLRGTLQDLQEAADADAEEAEEAEDDADDAEAEEDPEDDEDEDDD
ncbi:DUF5790 family protein [Halomarina litorea]|uniref:DUF5790 family protein n=1 Tax=Halomarina litorea TaxID=2961595 RepID=UPI0020C399F5|nr:DUF5790 family protein [Halomarina sp. BCD28]